MSKYNLIYESWREFRQKDSSITSNMINRPGDGHDPMKPTVDDIHDGGLGRDDDLNIQDPMGGMARPDQIKKNIQYDLEQCLEFVKNDRWEFRTLLQHIALRVEIIAEMQEDLDDKELENEEF